MAAAVLVLLFIYQLYLKLADVHSCAHESQTWFSVQD